ncbi:MAG: hypothetical protein MJZ40_03595, partial [Bacteroidaceae bacterium]|nr:hypothetical protein [Bacteroidaceae bacterium]
RQGQRNSPSGVKHARLFQHQLALINNKLTETFSGAIELKKGDALKPETGGTAKKKEEKKDLLANIIEKINLMYAGQFTEADRVIVETIYDKLQKAANKALKKQASNTDANMFAQNIFPKEFDKIAQACYMEQMDAFAKLFEDEQFYKRVMSEMAKAMYLNFRNATPIRYELPQDTGYAMAAEPD